MAVALTVTLLAEAVALLTSAAPIKRTTNGPVLTSDFPDPSIIKVDGTWYAFGTQSGYDNKEIHVQIASSTDFSSWSLHDGADALPDLPGWVDTSNPLVWAPDVLHLDDDTFVLYFSATTNTAGDGALHCIGTATSASITGPYTPAADPWACPTSSGGAIDAAGFRDADGTWYVAYKIDGNSLGHGGTCGNTVDPIVDTPLLVQRVDGGDGVTKSGGAATLLQLDAGAEGSDIEAPSLFRTAEGLYVLAYSSHCYSTDEYDVRYATSSGPTGGFVRKGVLVGGGQGGADVAFDAEHVLFHGLQDDGRRFLYTAILNVDGDSLSV